MRRGNPPGEAGTMFDFHYEKIGKNKDILRVVLTGKLDGENSDYLMDCVKDEVLDGSTKLVVDCGRLGYVSSLGLGMLVRIHSRMAKLGGDVKLANVQGTVSKLLGVVGLNRIFNIYATVEDAVAAHGG
jgi:anti-sigma B factor antagonist